MKFVAEKREGSQFGFAHRYSRVVAVPVTFGLDLEAAIGGRGRDEFDDGPIRGQGSSPPVHEDESKTGGVRSCPNVRCLGAVVTESSFEVRLFGQLGQLVPRGLRYFQVEVKPSVIAMTINRTLVHGVAEVRLTSGNVL